MSKNDDVLRREIKFITEISHELEVVVENIRHIILNNGVEIVGELLEDTIVMDMRTGQLTDINEDDAMYNDSYVVANPVKVMCDSYMGDSGLNTSVYFTNYNVCSDEPYSNFKKSVIVNMSRPNHSTILNYIETLHQLYNPDYYRFENLDDISDEELEIVFTNEIESAKEPDNNIIQFEPYLIRKRYE